MHEEDELLQEFLVECFDHLANIESQLLTLEEQGSDADKELVNVVFRAAHSIKGGAGFFGLHVVQELAHKIETSLSLMRNGELIPNAEVTNILFYAFDKLSELLHSPGSSNDVDITDHVVALTGLSSSYVSKEKKATLINNVELQTKNHRRFTVNEYDYNQAVTQQQYIYFVTLDLIHDFDRLGKSITKLIDDLVGCGNVLESRIAFDVVGTLEEDFTNSIPFEVLYATILDPMIAEAVFEVTADRIEIIYNPREAKKKIEVVDSPVIPITTSFPSNAMLPSNSDSSFDESESLIQLMPFTTTKEKATTTVAQEVITDTTLRVNISLLESLMTLAGELVLSRNQLLEAVSKKDSLMLSASTQKINTVTSELQEAIMQTRMQPISNVFGKFPRLVRDLSKELGKEVTLVVEGKDVELDKSLIEGLNDPLTHMVRNSLDHGIEIPADRIASNKTANGTIILKAYHEAGQVVIEIRDDGKGINPIKVAESALAKGLISETKIAAMSEKDRLTLIFLPGLSTKEVVSDLSGRGVGMDVVKTNLDRLGGKIEIDSEIGKGTLFKIKLPLTLAIIPSLIVGLDGDRFAIPQANVIELIRIPPEQIHSRVESIGDAEVLLLRGSLIPIINFARYLNLSTTVADPNGEMIKDRRRLIADRRNNNDPESQLSQAERDLRSNRRDRRANRSGELNLVVITTGFLQYALLVDEFHNTEEIVVKPLGRHFKGLSEFAGATIMGDGSVALIIDVGALATRSGMTSVNGSQRANQVKDESADDSADLQSFLTFRNGPDEHCAIPLDMVLRVERINHNQVEYLGGRRTMQYRGFSLPLVTLSDTANTEKLTNDQDWVVVVSNLHGKDLGLLCAMPVDTLQASSKIDNATLLQRGVYGSAVVNGHTTLFVNLFELGESVFPEWARDNLPVMITTEVRQQDSYVLLAEDSDFFRNQVQRYIEAAGYHVISAVDGQEAWELLQKNAEKIRLLVTDIEMPRMTGLELTRTIRKDSRFVTLPIIGLSSLAGEEDIQIGRTAGIDDYQIKIDKESLLERIQLMLR